MCLCMDADEPKTPRHTYLVDTDIVITAHREGHFVRCHQWSGGACVNPLV